MLHHSWGSWPICEMQLRCPDTKQKAHARQKNITCNLQLSTQQPMLLKTSLGRLSVSVCCHNHYCNAFLGKVLMHNDEQCQINWGSISNDGKVIEGRFVPKGVIYFRNRIGGNVGFRPYRHHPITGVTPQQPSLEVPLPLTSDVQKRIMNHYGILESWTSNK